MILQEGQKLGHYTIERLIGHGAFADVYLGEHVYLHTHAAIKILLERLGQQDLESFLNEARTIASLKHPHIVRVLDCGVEQGMPFLVMEYAPRGTLRQLHRRGDLLSLTEVVKYVEQVASALQVAHERKIVHRDIKPENILIGQHGELLLTDFGIAVMTQSSRKQEVSGTVSYMAPEQLQGMACEASDQYALAVMAYEWLTGTLPFSGSFAEVGSQHLFVSPPSLRGRAPHLSALVEQVIHKALSKDPRDRFLKVQDFAQALKAASNNDEAFIATVSSSIIPLYIPPTLSSMRHLPAVPQTVPPVPRQRALRFYQLTTALLVLLLIGGSIWTVWQRSSNVPIKPGITSDGTIVLNMTDTTPTVLPQPNGQAALNFYAFPIRKTLTCGGCESPVLITIDSLTVDTTLQRMTMNLTLLNKTQQRVFILCTEFTMRDPNGRLHNASGELVAFNSRFADLKRGLEASGPVQTQLVFSYVPTRDVVYMLSVKASINFAGVGFEPVPFQFA